MLRNRGKNMKINLCKISYILFFSFIVFSDPPWEKAALALESKLLNADVPQEAAKELTDTTPSETSKTLKDTTPTESPKELKDTTSSEALNDDED
jgi:hypothetical protein